MELQHLLNYCTMNLHNYNLPVMTWSKWLSAKNLEHNTAKGSVTKQTAVIFKYNITNEYHTNFTVRSNNTDHSAAHRTRLDNAWSYNAFIMRSLFNFALSARLWSAGADWSVLSHSTSSSATSSTLLDSSNSSSRQMLCSTMHVSMITEL